MNVYEILELTADFMTSITTFYKFLFLFLFIITPIIAFVNIRKSVKKGAK